MRFIFKITIAILIALTFVSCATIFSGSHDRVIIDSDPQGAEIYFEGNNLGTTPQEVSLKRRFSYLNDGRVPIKLVLPGYSPVGYGYGYGIDANFNIVSAFNILLLPLGIDALTGSITDYEEYYMFKLVPKSESELINNNEHEINYDELIIIKELYDDGVLTKEEYESEKKKILKK